jgi:hypothetical protein
MTEGRLRSPLEPIDQPFADWMRAIVMPMDHEQGRACPLRPHSGEEIAPLKQPQNDERR